MPSERIQLRIDRLLEEADAAVHCRGWSEYVPDLGHEDGQSHIVMEA